MYSVTKEVSINSTGSTSWRLFSNHDKIKFKMNPKGQAFKFTRPPKKIIFTEQSLYLKGNYKDNYKIFELNSKNTLKIWHAAK